jgi:CO dehydrogenase nickel-insertion accessory protein CooC1
MEIILNKLGHLPTEFFALKSRNVFAVNADKDINVSKLLNLAIAEEYMRRRG